MGIHQALIHLLHIGQLFCDVDFSSLEVVLRLSSYHVDPDTIVHIFVLKDEILGSQTRRSC